VRHRFDCPKRFSFGGPFFRGFSEHIYGRRGVLSF
jgi:hypothetical protein